MIPPGGLAATLFYRGGLNDAGGVNRPGVNRQRMARAKWPAGDVC